VWFPSPGSDEWNIEGDRAQRAIEQERARIAHDIHDDLGSYLTRITMLSETAN